MIRGSAAGLYNQYSSVAYLRWFFFLIILLFLFFLLVLVRLFFLFLFLVIFICAVLFAKSGIRIGTQM